METKKETDEITKAASDGENKEMPSKSDQGNTPFQEETTISPSGVKDEEAHLVKKKGLWNWLKDNIDSTQIVNLIVALTATIIGGLIVFLVQKGITKLIIHQRCYSKPYITFESDFTQVFSLSNEIIDLNLEYSVGEKKWRKLNKQAVMFGGSHGKLMLRGRNELGTLCSRISFATDAQVICTGDICTLVDYKNYDHADTRHASFSELFWGCKQLVVAPKLSPKVLAEGCYCLMFYGCTSLQTAPELPVMELNSECYKNMFLDCTSLQIAPELPATTMSKECYSGMFKGCTSLEKAPQLPSTELAESCYSDMFEGCTSLYWLPKLPAEELADYCYSNMFYGCTSLDVFHDLPAKKTSNRCYLNMFYGCTSLSTIQMMAEDVQDNSCKNWLEGTSPTGTFYKNKNATWSNDGIVPPGWKVVLVDP